MAQTLNNSPPSSSIARLFDQDAAARALRPAETSFTQPLASDAQQPVSGDRNQMASRVIKREFVLSPSTEDSLARLVQIYRNATGTRLSNSHVLRAVLRGVSYGLPAIEREAHRIGELKLPSNARRRDAEREHFENALASAFIAGMRTLPAFANNSSTECPSCTD